MWFFSSKKPKRTPKTPSRRSSFRPQLDALEDRCLMTAGALDPTFGNGGMVSGTAGIYRATAVAVEPDGKIVAGGYATNVNGHAEVFALARYNTDGTLDTTFGNNGVVQTVVGATNSWVNGLTIQSDGKIVAVGSAAIQKKNTYDDSFAVTRYNSNGTLDTTFGGNGTVLTDVGPAYTPIAAVNFGPGAHAIAFDGSGNLDVTGTVNPGGAASQYDQIAIFRYKPNGALDTTFGSSHNGMVITAQFGHQSNEAVALAIQSGGQIVLAGYTGWSSSTGGMDLVRYTGAGQLDSTFGTNGIVTGLAPAGTTAIPYGVMVQNSGGIVVSHSSIAGSSTTQTLVRVTSTGHLDFTFGNSGFANNAAMRKGTAIVQGPNGDLLVSGSSQVNDLGYTELGVAAFLSNGIADAAFGTSGTTTADFTGINSTASSLAIQQDGKIVAAGLSSGIALARFLAPDTKIGSFTANPNPVTAGSNVTLSASGILNSNPSSTIVQVAFYQDANGNGILDSGDTLLGYGTNVNGVWSFTFTPTTSGTYTLFAQATDSNGVLSDPVALTLQVI